MVQTKYLQHTVNLNQKIHIGVSLTHRDTCYIVDRDSNDSSYTYKCQYLNVLFHCEVSGTYL